VLNRWERRKRCAGFQPPSDTFRMSETFRCSLASATLTQLAPMVLGAPDQGTSRRRGFNKDSRSMRSRSTGGYILNVSLGVGSRSVSDVPSAQHEHAQGARRGAGHYGLRHLMATGPDRVSDGRDNVQVTFSLETPGPGFVGLPSRKRAALKTASGWSRGIWVATTLPCAATWPTPWP